MAMYYESRSELIEAENNPIHTLYLMNPNYIHTTPPHPQSSPAQDISAMWGGGGGEIGNYHQQPQPQHAADGLMMMMGSKYLKAAQELLDELVNVGSHRTTDKPKPINKEVDHAANTAAAADLTPTQRQEIQIKKAKLHTMLDEVEQRCRQYHQQMQMIVAAFEQVAGPGSARSYTQLALKTILKQFRCLKSTITAQVKALSKSLGEVEQGSEMSRLRFVDPQPQPQPQVHNNAWRPQRGLPERAVSVLRAWLFQHFLHPYPKDSDKQVLAKQTGLTRSQVSNWFINARVRVWKPMVEEMYLQETNNNVNAAPPSIKAEPAAASSPLKKRSNESMLHQTNAFSLSLALPPFLPFDFQPSPLDAAAAARIIDFHNRKTFPPHLLPDFVAS